MNRKIERHLLALTCVAVAALNLPAASAGQSNYQCEISEHLILTGKGELVRPSTPYMIGQQFAIDRRTGQVTGSVLQMWGNPKFQVIRQGSDVDWFIATGTNKQRSGGTKRERFTFIRVEEFATGPDKPFIVNTGSPITSVVASGICK